jgi:N-acyl-D-aspartate/D-glutamate deacylase
VYEQQLTSCDRATEKGARVVALTLPDLMRMRAGKILESMPAWRDVVSLADDERRRAVADPDTRQRLRDGAAEAANRGLAAATKYDLLEVADAPEGSEALIGKTIAEIADERGAEPVDVLIDIVLAERLPLIMLFPSVVPSLGRSDEGWQVRAGLWRDERVVLGGSDAGAHIDLMCHANYTTAVLGDSVRERKLLTLEEAVHELADVPARLYGLRERGRVADGWHADLVVFDPATVGTGPTVALHDLPGGGERLSNGAQGIAHVFVNGRELIADGVVTGELPGTLLRSGVDTDTVSVPGA